MDNQQNNQNQQIPQMPPAPIQPIVSMPSQPQMTNAQPKKKMPTWLKVLSIVGGVIIVLAIVLVLVLKDNDSEVNSFLNALYRRDFITAYNYFAPELKEVQSREEFEMGARTLNLDESCTTDWTTNMVGVSTSVGSYKEIAGIITCDSGIFNASFKFIKQGDNYRIYSYYIKP